MNTRGESWTLLIFSVAMAMDLSLIVGALEVSPGRYPNHEFSLLSRGRDKAASVLSNAQKSSLGKIAEPMMFRYCTDSIADDCDDFMSGNGQCVNLGETVSSGSFLPLYPSKRCYLYTKLDCKGMGNYQYQDRWYVANNDDKTVSSYRCFK